MWVWIYLFLFASSAAQPGGWKIRLDKPGSFSNDPYFVATTPGWQITTGPSVIAYEQAAVAGGVYRLESEATLLPGDQNEGYGVFIGGTALDSNELSYTAFQLRRDGKFSIWTRKGATMREIVPWTSHPAIVAQRGGLDPAKNAIAINVRADEVAFSVNGRTVSVGRRTSFSVEGNYGFRVHDNLSVHFASLALRPLP